MRPEEQLRELALATGQPLLYALVRAMQRIDVEHEVGYVGDADLLEYVREGERLIAERQPPVIPTTPTTPTTPVEQFQQDAKPDPVALLRQRQEQRKKAS